MSVYVFFRLSVGGCGAPVQKVLSEGVELSTCHGQMVPTAYLER